MNKPMCVVTPCKHRHWWNLFTHHINKSLSCIMHVSTAEGPRRTENLLMCWCPGAHPELPYHWLKLEVSFNSPGLRSSSQVIQSTATLSGGVWSLVPSSNPSKLTSPEIQLHPLFCMVPRCPCHSNQGPNTSGPNCG